MKAMLKTAITTMFLLMILLIGAVPTLASDAPQPFVCETSQEFVSCLLEQAGQRAEYFSITIPDTLPEADMGGSQLFKDIMLQDRGDTRWGLVSAAVAKTQMDGSTTFYFKLIHRSTKEQDEAARRMAAAIVAQWNHGALSAYEKIDSMRDYISANWRYDETLTNMTAYSTLNSGNGTCLGFVLAAQLMLDEMGIASQAVQGRLTLTDEYHIRLLVELDGWWYTLDPTELAFAVPKPLAYLGNEFTSEFSPSEEYLTYAFRMAHPMNPLGLSR